MFKFIYTTILLVTLNANVALSYDLKNIEPKDISQHIYQNDKIKLVFIFTSWCSACKRSLLDVINIADDFKNQQFEVILLSLDEDMSQLVKALQPYYQSSVKVFRIDQGSSSAVMNGLMRAKIKYNGRIPNIVVIDKSGEIVVNGNYHLNQVHNVIKSML